MFSRFTIYFDEVVRSGSIRRASERLNISPSAIDRHILLMEERLGVRLFERLQSGLRLTAAGEVLIGYVRRWRRELGHAQAQIDDLRGLRRGEVSLAYVEGASEYLANCLVGFKTQYPGIEQLVQVSGAQGVVDLVLDGKVEIGLTINPAAQQNLRLERTLIYQIGAVVPVGHPLAQCADVAFTDCAEYGLVVPDSSVSLRQLIDRLWAKNVGGPLRSAITASSVSIIKSLVRAGAGVGLLTPLDIAAEIASSCLVHVPLRESDVPLSVLSLITASGRATSVPASLLVQHIAQVMRETDIPGTG